MHSHPVKGCPIRKCLSFIHPAPAKVNTSRAIHAHLLTLTCCCYQLEFVGQYRNRFFPQRPPSSSSIIPDPLWNSWWSGSSQKVLRKYLKNTGTKKVFKFAAGNSDDPGLFPLRSEVLLQNGSSRIKGLLSFFDFTLRWSSLNELFLGTYLVKSKWPMHTVPLSLVHYILEGGSGGQEGRRS